jgi:hypothetical protein
VAFELELRQSPKMALGPALRGLKRAAEAKKCQRIAGRLAALAGTERAGSANVSDLGGLDGRQRADRRVQVAHEATGKPQSFRAHLQ